MHRLPLPLVLALSACLQNAPTTISAPATGKRVLFVGNSQVYVNDLPRMVAQLAREARVDSVFVASVAFPNFGLEDHWADGSAVRALQQSKWEFVVLQQGPSTLPENRANLETMVRRFDPTIRAAGAVPVLYQVWPTVDRPNDFGAALISYQLAAKAVGGILAPAGEAWRGAIADADTIRVYSPDGLHGSVRGTYLAAIVILARLFETDPRTLPPTIPGIREDSVTVRFLQRMAAAALTRAPARP